MFLRNLLLAIIILLIVSPVAAFADMWPSRPVKIPVPYAAEGNSDGMARIAAQREIVFDTSRPDGTPQKLLDMSRLTKLGWTARTELRNGTAAAYRDFLKGGAR